jgi:lipopolysaccharide export system protein LptC
MNTGRTLLDRLTSWAPALLLGSLAALTYWLDAQVQSPQPRIDGSARHDPNLFVERFRAITFDTDGRVRQSLAAQRAQLYPDDNSIDFASVSLVQTDPDSPRVTVTADSGTLSGDRETITLAGNVRAVRDAPPAAPKPKARKPGQADAGPGGPVTLTTEYLRVVPKQGRATTDREVTIEEPRGIIRAVGMVLDNKAKTLTLKSGVQGSLQPQPLQK